MQATLTERLLQVWEETARAHPIRLALALLEAAWPGLNAQSWARMPVGERDARLLDLHDAWFGGAFETAIDCAGCGMHLESSFAARDIRVPSSARRGGTLRHEGREIQYRLPDSEDLLAAAAIAEAPKAEQAVLKRCLGWTGGEDLVPAALAERLDAEMALLDPGADIELRLRCPQCGTEQAALFDIVTHLAGEIDDWAQGVLADVHLLARAYGWSEGEILGLSPARRRSYTQMVLQ